MTGRKVDWNGLMRLGIGRLRLAPETFWAMSPREFAAALDGAGVAAPVGRAQLGQLMAKFPDGAAPRGVVLRKEPKA